MKYKVRFHLGRGPHYKHWQIRCGKELVAYVHPSETLLLFGSKLKNRALTAKRIFEGGPKTVCAWIECDSVARVTVEDSGWSVLDGSDYFQFNPRHYPAWLNSYSEECDDKEAPVVLIDSGTIIEASILTTEDVQIEEIFKC